MVSLKSLLLYLSTTASALTLPRRDASTLQQDLIYINSNVTALNTAIGAYTSGVLSAIPIQTAENALSASIQQGTTDANSSLAVSSTDAAPLLAYINSTLSPNIGSALQALVGKKAQFKTDGLTTLVLNDLTGLNSTNAAFGAALLAKTPVELFSQGQAELSVIQGDLANAIAAFS